MHENEVISIKGVSAELPQATALQREAVKIIIIRFQ
jgi:hypothetical protein